MGVVTALGIGIEKNLCSLKKHISGIGKSHFLPNSDKYPVGEVKLSNEDIKEKLSINSLDVYSRTSLLGMLSVQEALETASINKNMIGLISGTTVDGKDIREKYYDIDYNPSDPNQYHISTTNQIADYFRCFDYTSTISTACSSALNAIINAAIMVEVGIKDIIVAGGTESLSASHYNGFSSLRILDKSQCSPFDKKRAGLNLGEGAGFVVLESEQSMKKRGVKPLAIIEGYGNACDAFHHTTSSPSGEGAYLAMSIALESSRLNAYDIQYINAHGTGTLDNDKTESVAIKRLFGENIPAVSSTKGYTGHTTSACGGIETVFSILAMNNNFIPGNLGFMEEDPDCIIPESNGRKYCALQHVMCNCFGFGGNDSSLIIGKTRE